MAGSPPAGDEYTRWYRQDAQRVLQAQSFEGAYHHRRRIRMVVALLGRLGARRILDLGCGDGWQVDKLVKAGFEVVGCDISPERLRRARLQAPGAAGFFVGDLRLPPLSPASVECIYMGQVLEHLPDPGEVLRHLFAAIRPGGHLILDTPCRDNLIDDLLRLSGLSERFPEALEWGLQIDPGHLHFLRLKEIAGLLEQAGFEFVLSRGAPRLRWNTPRIGNYLATHPRLWPIHDLLEWALGLLPRYRDVGAIVVCVARRPAGAGRAETRSGRGGREEPACTPG